jgi:hypothetical protein
MHHHAVPANRRGFPDEKNARNPGGSARKFVRGITAERNEVRHLVWIDAISLPDLFGPDARYFPTPRRADDRSARRGERKKADRRWPLGQRRLRAPQQLTLVCHRNAAG